MAGVRLVSACLRGLQKVQDESSVAHIVFSCGSPVADFALCGLAVLLSIASDKSQDTRQLTSAGAITTLVKVLDTGLQTSAQSLGRQVSSLAMMRYASRTLLQLSQHAFTREEFVQRGALRPLVQLCTQAHDEELVSSVLLVLANLATDAECATLLLQTRLVQSLMLLVDSTKPTRVIYAAVRVITSLASHPQHPATITQVRSAQAVLLTPMHLTSAW
jgi:hypothetical protein